MNLRFKLFTLGPNLIFQILEMPEAWRAKGKLFHSPEHNLAFVSNTSPQLDLCSGSASTVFLRGELPAYDLKTATRFCESEEEAADLKNRILGALRAAISTPQVSGLFKVGDHEFYLQKLGSSSIAYQCVKFPEGLRGPSAMQCEGLTIVSTDYPFFQYCPELREVTLGLPGRDKAKDGKLVTLDLHTEVKRDEVYSKLLQLLTHVPSTSDIYSFDLNW